MPSVSILTVTLNRFDIATQYFGPALERAGYPFSLMSLDNGSEDGRIIEYIAGFKPVWHGLAGENIGYAPALNQMLLRLNTDYACVLDPDILPQRTNWLKDLVEMYEDISADGKYKPGSCGIRCIFEYDEEMTVAGHHVYRTWNCFGQKFFHRSRLDTVGYYCEEYGRYGNEDIDINHRYNKLGYTNFYIEGLAAHHNDASDTGPYRMQKWRDLKVASAVWERREKYMNETHDYYVAPPQPREIPCLLSR